jgi:hypothetical protein
LRHLFEGVFPSARQEEEEEKGFEQKENEARYIIV